VTSLELAVKILEHGPTEYTLLYPPRNMTQLAGKYSGGDPRWGGCTALHGSIISNQPSIAQFLVDHGAKLDAKNVSGWTPLAMTRGVFLANAKREYPAAAEIIWKAIIAQGLAPAGSSPPPPTPMSDLAPPKR